MLGASPSTKVSFFSFRSWAQCKDVHFAHKAFSRSRGDETSWTGLASIVKTPDRLALELAIRRSPF